MSSLFPNCRVDALKPEYSFYAVVEPKNRGLSGYQWAEENLQKLHEGLNRFGVVMLRGFSCDVEEFSRIADLFSPRCVPMAGQISPRKPVLERVTTSTELEKEHTIPQHHEMAYDAFPPMHVLFYCEKAPPEMGETPCADAREFIKSLSPQIVDNFARKGVTYIRNYTPGMPIKGLEETFEATGREAIQAASAKVHIEVEWVSDIHARAIQRRGGVARHPRTGDRVFFNDASLWHSSNIARMVDVYGEEARKTYDAAAPIDKWVNSMYGDGSEIDSNDVVEILELYKEKLVPVPYEDGDILIIDNFLASHGRNPFTSDRRRVLASIRGPLQPPYLAP